MPPLYTFEIVGFLFGLIFGSFLNVCISRLPGHESVVTPRSRCPRCKTTIPWYDNIPVLSWLFLRARCRYCKQPISIQYPLVELCTGIWFLVAAHHLYNLHSMVPTGVGSTSTDQWINGSISVLAFAILGFLLIGLLVMDWQTQLLPDAFTLTGIAIALLLVCTQAIFLGPDEDQIVLNTTHQLRLSSPGSFTARGNVFLTGPEALIFGRLIAILGVATILVLIRWVYRRVRHREGLGLGDVKLLAMIAAFLGFWPAILALFVGVLSASVYAIFLLARGKAGLASKLPLGTFLAIGGLVAAQFGNSLINAYKTLLQ